MADASRIAGFLARFAPFDAVEPDEILRVAAAVEARAYTAGETVLVEDGRPAQHFYVIRDGSMELVHEDEVIDVLEPGEGFGHPSLLTGLAPAFTVRAHEDSTCFLIPREAAMRVLAGPAGAGHVAVALRERVAQTGHTGHAPPAGRTGSVGDPVRRAAI